MRRRGRSGDLSEDLIGEPTIDLADEPTIDVSGESAIDLLATNGDESEAADPVVVDLLGDEEAAFLSVPTVRAVGPDDGDADGTGEVDLPMARPPRRRRGRTIVPVLVAVIGVIVLTGTLALASRMSATRKTPVYAARAEITYTLDEDRTPGLLRQDRRLSTQLVMISGRTVLGPVADELGLDWEDLADAVSAEVVDDSEVIRIEAQASDPEGARRVVDAVLDEYLEQAEVDVYAEQRTLVQDQLTAAEARRAEVAVALTGAQLQRFGVPIDAQQLLAENSSLLAEIDRLKDQLTRMDLAQVDAQPAKLLTPTYVLDEPVEPRVRRSTIIGAALGLLFGLTWVVLVAQFPRFRRP